MNLFGGLDAVIFDMDGVVTNTAELHARAWKRVFDEYLREAGRGKRFRPFDIRNDYRTYVDGKQRYDGVESFLSSRGISLPHGRPDDPPDRETICGIGNRKNRLYLSFLDTRRTEPYPSTVRLIKKLREAGIRTAIISASRNCVKVLAAARVSNLFDVKVDGVDVDSLGLKGKPAPDIFLEAARRLGCAPSRVAVVEDAVSGVRAASAGGVKLVVGIDRTGNGESLREGGADVVVRDLAEVLDEDGRRGDSEDERREIRELPSAISRVSEIEASLGDRKPALFLDYDGTLTPIVEDPAKALLPKSTKLTLKELSKLCPLVILSGRDLPDVRKLVGIEGIAYAGSHGFDLVGPDGSKYESHWGSFLPSLDSAESEMAEAIRGIRGARIERKRFALTVHYRTVGPSMVRSVRLRFGRVAARHRDLRVSKGKKVLELLPNVKWDKGRALLFLMDRLGVGLDRFVPVFIGDDTTDEDGLRVVRARGVGIVVGEGSRATRARYSLRDPEETQTFLRALLSSLRRNRN